MKHHVATATPVMDRVPQIERHHVTAQLHALLEIACELAQGVALAESCVNVMRVSRGAIDYLAGGACDVVQGTAPGGPYVASTLTACTERVREQLRAGMQAQLLINGATFSAAEAINDLQVDLKVLTEQDPLSPAIEIAELLGKALAVVSNSISWVRLAVSASQQLDSECVQLQRSLDTYLSSERLTAETLLKARLGSTDQASCRVHQPRGQG